MNVAQLEAPRGAHVAVIWCTSARARLGTEAASSRHAAAAPERGWSSLEAARDHSAYSFSVSSAPSWAASCSTSSVPPASPASIYGASSLPWWVRRPCSSPTTGCCVGASRDGGDRDQALRWAQWGTGAAAARGGELLRTLTWAAASFVSLLNIAAAVAEDAASPKSARPGDKRNGASRATERATSVRCSRVYLAKRWSTSSWRM